MDKSVGFFLCFVHIPRLIDKSVGFTHSFCLENPL